MTTGDPAFVSDETMAIFQAAYAGHFGTDMSHDDAIRAGLEAVLADLAAGFTALTLTPVEVFGGCDHPGCDGDCGTFGYGLSDAVGPAWSDCNRAEGRIYRVEDTPDPDMDFEGEQVRVRVMVLGEDAGFFQRKHGDPREGTPMRRCGHCAADTAGPADELPGIELPGMWEEADFLGGSPDVVRGGTDA